MVYLSSIQELNKKRKKGFYNMKKAEFYNDIKTNVHYLTGLKRASWYKDGGSIVVRTSKQLVSLSCNYNVVTLYTKLDGEKGKTEVTDYNTSYKDNMVTLTAEKVYKFLTD